MQRLLSAISTAIVERSATRWLKATKRAPARWKDPGVSRGYGARSSLPRPVAGSPPWSPARRSRWRSSPQRPAGEAQVVEKTVTVTAKEVPVETVVTKAVHREVAVERSMARPAATTFQDNPRQPVVATADDAMSTFSLDTDRTSYQLALTWAQQGYDIEPDSVRAEEWINAFNYQYAPPADAWGLCDYERSGRSSAGRAQAPGADWVPGGGSPGRPAAQRDAGARRVGVHA